MSLLSLLIIFLVSIVCYTNSIKGSFVFDDLSTIVNRAEIKDLSNIRKIWNHQPSRFIPNLTFALNYHFSRLDETSYHLVNLSIHIISGFSTFFFISYLQKLIFVKKVSRKIWHLPLVASLIFISHPIQIQAVTFITQRYASLAALFYLLTMTFFLKVFLVKRTYIFFYALSLFFAVCALLTKENTYTLPFAILVLQFYFLRRKIGDLRRIILFTLPYFLLAFVTYYFTFLVHRGIDLLNVDKHLSTLSALEGFSISHWQYLLTQFNVVRTYIRLLFLPVNQIVDYDYPISSSVSDLPTIFSLIFLVVLMFFTILLFKKNKLASFGIIFFFLTLSVESSIIPIKDVIFEHRLYFPLVGFVIIVSSILVNFYTSLAAKFKNNKLFSVKVVQTGYYFFIALIIAFLSFATYQRNKVWENEYTLWSDAVKKSPNKARVHYNLGVALADRGKFSEAFGEFEKTVKLDQQYVDAYHNLGAIYEKNGQMEEAYETYLKAIQFAPTNTNLHNSFGSLLAKLGRFEEAVKEYAYILQIEPENATALNNLGVVYIQQDSLDEAIKLLQKALEIKPYYENALSNLASAYFRQGKYDEALQTYQQILIIDSSNA